jgi:general stress protein 26
MFFIFDEETRDIFIITSLRSKKMRNIRDNSQVSLTVDVRDPEDPFNNRGVMVVGEAKVEKTIDSLSAVRDKELMRVYDAFQKKYPVLASRAQRATQIEYQRFTEVLLRICARKMVYWRGPRFITVNFNPQV